MPDLTQWHRPTLNDAAAARRGLLVALLGVCSCALAPVAVGSAAMLSDSAALDEWLRFCATSCLLDMPALRRLGAIYLDAHPEERSRAILSQLLIERDEGTIVSRLRGAVDLDWRTHQVAVVDGWLLARSEARLCAALHLGELARA